MDIKQWRWASILRLAFLVLTGAIVFPVVGEFFIELAKARGYYADSDARFSAFVSILGNFLGYVAIPWWAAVAFASFAAGLCVDAALRRIDWTRDQRLKAIGHECRALAVDIHIFIDNEGVHIDRMLPKIATLLMTLRKNKIPYPSVKGRATDLPLLIEMGTFFSLVGAMLADGHIDDARKLADRLAKTKLADSGAVLGST